MRYGKVTGLLYGTNHSTLLQSFRDTFPTIPGWEMVDDMTTAATPYVVFKTTTSEGPTYPFYTRFMHLGADNIRVDLYEAWNSSTHAGSGNHSGGGRIETNHGTRNTALTYYYCGDQDHLIFYINTQADSIHMPTYIGLTTKMQANVDGPLGVIMLTWYMQDGHTAADNEAYSFSDYNKVPVLRGSDGLHERISKIFSSNPNFENVNTVGYIPAGPYISTKNGEQRRDIYAYPLVLVEKARIGPRGIVKNVLCVGNTYYSQMSTEQPVKIGSRDYLLVRVQNTYTDATVSNRNPWGQFYGSGSWNKNYLIPLNDYHVPCYIEGN